MKQLENVATLISGGLMDLASKITKRLSQTKVAVVGYAEKQLKKKGGISRLTTFMWGLIAVGCAVLSAFAVTILLLAVTVAMLEAPRF